jgi:hypothetical protein
MVDVHAVTVEVKLAVQAVDVTVLVHAVSISVWVTVSY